MQTPNIHQSDSEDDDSSLGDDTSLRQQFQDSVRISHESPRIPTRRSSRCIMVPPPSFSSEEEDDDIESQSDDLPNYPQVAIHKNIAQDKRWKDPYWGETGRYTGEFSFSTNMPHGKGRMDYENQSWCEGDWLHGRMHGNGAFYDSISGDYYQGGFKSHAKDGVGIMKFANGCWFEGEYLCGEMKRGKMTYPDGSTYSGSFAKGKRHGKGQNLFGDGSVYEGDFENGKLHGHGKLTWSDGGYYIGEWHRGEQHGRGKEIRPDGTLRHNGKWDHGHPIRLKKSHPHFQRARSEPILITKKPKRTKPKDPLAVSCRSQRNELGLEDMATEHNKMGLSLLQQGKMDQAISLFLQAMKLELKGLAGATTKNNNKSSCSIGVTQGNLGLAYEQKGELEAARDMYRHALRQQRSALGKQHQEVAKTLDKLARIHTKEGYWNRAIQLLEESLEIKTKAFGADHAEVITTSNMLESARRRRRNHNKNQSEDADSMEERIHGNRDFYMQSP